MYIEKIAKRLKEARKNKGLTQEEVAIATKISRNTLSRYENGTRRPSLENLEQLADNYNISIDWIFGREEKI